MNRDDPALETRHWIGILAERFPSGIVIVDAAGVVQLANATAHHHLRSTTPEALQVAVREVVDALEDGVRLELPARGDRHGLVVERISGEGDGALLVLNDVHELDAADQDLLLANRMRGLEELYRAMAHDLKSPLQAIVLNIDLLRERTRAEPLEDDLQEDVEKYLDVIHGEISRLGRSIQSLLSQAGAATRRERRIDVRRIQREVATLMEPLARRKSIRLRTSAPRESVLVMGNRDRLKQALLNLAVNAIEAMGRHGSLEFDVSVQNGEVRLEVRDDGPGIPEELEGRVFETHFTTKSAGTGIGLGVARSIGRGHGGDLELLRREPRGTTARLRLPLAG